MIGKLRGVWDATENGREIIVWAGDVGYLVSISANTRSCLPARPNRVELLIHTIVGETKLDLYGFLGTFERVMFDLLTTVRGIGANKAIAILGPGPLTIKGYLINGDAKALADCPGVGKKTAELLISELQMKAARL